VSRWWESLREASKEAAEAMARKQDAVRKAAEDISFKGGYVPDDEKDLIPEKELTNLNESVAVARDKFNALLRAGAEKHYAAPIADQKPFVIYFAEARYTLQARRKEVSGVVKTQALFLADGTMGQVKILQGLGHGLDERAVETINNVVFLPAVKEGSFVAYRQAIEVEFRLR